MKKKHISYWPNGMIKETGQMLNNKPIDDWLVYDEKGNHIITNSWMLDSDGISFIYSSIKHKSSELNKEKFISS
tara:strand:+ start:206 stop:427 length:222 start_codon:yes stop_codon:yes gene_type:complete